MNVQISKTRHYYNTLSDSSLCDCSYCRNYRTHIRTALPVLCAALQSLGIDPQKPFETSPLEPDENGILEYCACQYVVFGSCGQDFHHSVDGVEIYPATSYPSTGISGTHFVLEISPVRLPYCTF